MWSVRLLMTSGHSVVVARGELDRSATTVVYEPGEDIVYFPGDALLVIFDEPAARALATLASFGSAWGSSLEL
jgi:hypothetical protein